MAPTVFIDGATGTTGLEIRERLSGRTDISLLELPEDDRKNLQARRDALNNADLAILCLPDEAARQALSLVNNPTTRIIDASSAHRTAPDWVFGFPELEATQRERIAGAKRVSNPGCYSTGFLALVRPLIRARIVPADFPITVNAVSGYSGGGKALIEAFEDRGSPRFIETVLRTYALTLAHKHVPEMQKHAGLTHPPLFAPSVARFYRGMLVEVPLQLWALPTKPTVFELHNTLTKHYAGERLIEVAAFDAPLDALQAYRQGRPDIGGVVEATAPLQTLDAEMLRFTNGIKLFVFGNDKTQQVRLIAVLDNLGKGAAGAAVQNLNLMLGRPETTSLL